MNKNYQSSLAQLDQTLSEAQLGTLVGGLGYDLHPYGVVNTVNAVKNGEPIPLNIITLYTAQPNPNNDIAAPTLVIGRSNGDVTVHSYFNQ